MKLCRLEKGKSYIFKEQSSGAIYEICCFSDYGYGSDLVFYSCLGVLINPFENITLLHRYIKTFSFTNHSITEYDFMDGVGTFSFIEEFFDYLDNLGFTCHSPKLLKIIEIKTKAQVVARIFYILIKETFFEVILHYKRGFSKRCYIYSSNDINELNLKGFLSLNKTNKFINVIGINKTLSFTGLKSILVKFFDENI